MIFSGYFNHAYTVEELSFKQAEWLLAQQAIEESEANESARQILNGCYSYRSSLDKKNRSAGL